MKINKIIQIAVLSSAVSMAPNAYACWTCADLPKLDAIKGAIDKLIDTLSNLGGELIQGDKNLVTAIDESVASSSTELGSRLVRARQIDKARTRTPNEGSCNDATLAVGAGAGGAGTPYNHRNLNANALKKMNDGKTSGAHQQEFLDRTPFCTAEDALNKPECAAAGSMPGADIQPQGLRSGAVANNETTNSSITDDKTASGLTQKQIAELEIKNIVMPNPPRAIGKQNTAQNKDYSSKWGFLMSRVAIAFDSFNRITAFSTVNKQATDSYKGIWAEFKDVYTRVFPWRKMPVAPSEREYLEFMVASRYADTGTSPDAWQNKLSTMSLEESNRDIAQQLAVTNRLLQELLSRSEDISQNTATLLAQTLSPITTSDLQRMYNNK